MNFFFQWLVKYMINLAYLSQKSLVAKEIMVYIFLAIYFNTGWVMMIATANFDYTFLRGIPIRNYNPDYT